MRSASTVTTQMEEVFKSLALLQIQQFRLITAVRSHNDYKTFSASSFFMARYPLWANASSLLRFRAQSDTPHCSGRMISSSQTPLFDNTQHPQQTSMSPAGFEPAFPASERPQTNALDHAATGID